MLGKPVSPWLGLGAGALRMLRPISLLLDYPCLRIPRLETSGKFPADMRIPPLKMKVLLESLWPGLSAGALRILRRFTFISEQVRAYDDRA